MQRHLLHSPRRWVVPTFLILITMLFASPHLHADFVQDGYTLGGLSTRVEISDAIGSGMDRNARETADNFNGVIYDPTQHILKVTWFGGAMSDMPGTTPHDSFEISFYDTARNVPGTKLATYNAGTFTTVSVDPLFSDIPDINFYRYEAFLSGGVSLSGSETYWLSVMELDTTEGGPDAGDAWYWMGATQDLLPDEKVRDITAGVPGAWMDSPNGNLTWGRAFRIQVLPVPEPGSMTLLGICGACLIFRRRRDHSRFPVSKS